MIALIGVILLSFLSISQSLEFVANIAINKSLAKGIENGKIVQNLPEGKFGGRMVPLFTPLSLFSKFLDIFFSKAYASRTPLANPKTIFAIRKDE